MVLVGAVGKVEASNAHASHQQLFNHFHAARLGAQRADNLESARMQHQSHRAGTHTRRNTVQICTLVLQMDVGLPESTASSPSLTPIVAVRRSIRSQGECVTRRYGRSTLTTTMGHNANA